MVNTNVHGDHSYSTYYLSDKVGIIQHAAAKANIDDHFAADKTFMM